MIRRPLCVMGFPFSIAMWAAFYFDGKTALLLSAAFLGTAVLCWLIGKDRLVFSVAIFSVAAAFSVYSLHHYRNIAPFERADGRLITVEGLVLETKNGTRSTDYLVDAYFPKVGLPACKVSVRVYGESQANAGDFIRCRIELTPAKGAYYMGNGIRARGVAENGLTHLDTDGYRFERERLRLRAALTRNLYAKLPRESADVAGTMAIKIGENPDSVVYAHMNRSGISHVLSISGMHFSILAALLLSLLRGLLLPRRVPELTAIALSFLFVALTGFTPSILRSFIMFLIMTLGQLAFRRGDGINSLGMAMLVIGIFWPDWMQGISIWLSAFSTLGILTLGGRFTEFITTRILRVNGRPGKLAKSIASSSGVSLGAYLFTLPLLVLNYGWIPLLSLPANILIAPFVTPIMLGGMLCAAIPGNPFPVRIIASITDFCVKFTLRISEILSELPLATMSVDHTWMIIWIFGTILMIAVVFLAKSKEKLAGWMAMLCIFGFGIGFLTEKIPDRNRVELITLDNCSSSLLLRGDSAVILGMPQQYEAGRLTNYLEYRGIRQISALIAPDAADHVNSGALRLNEYPIEAVIGPEDDYRLDLLARAYKGVPVYSPAFATLTALGGVSVTAENSGVLTIRIGGRMVTWEAGELSLPVSAKPLPEPLGQRLYGESRYLFTVN